MPGKDRFWLDDGQRRAPVIPEAGQADPQQAVGGGQFQAFCRRSPEHSDLVAQSQVLEIQAHPDLASPKGLVISFSELPTNIRPELFHYQSQSVEGDLRAPDIRRVA
jgi:hypothetical protein